MTEITIFYGSVYGAAEALAEQVCETLEEMGHQARVVEDPQVGDFKQAQFPLVITSTTGQGDLPPNLEFFIADIKDTFPLLKGKPFAVVGLGDSSYDHFCGAGHQVFELMQELQGRPIADLLEVDAIETLEPETQVLPWIKQHFSE